MKSISELQGLWPNFQTFADDVGVEYGTAQQWRVRGSIPGEHWHKIVSKAAERGIKGVTFKVLEGFKQKKPESVK